MIWLSLYLLNEFALLSTGEGGTLRFSHHTEFLQVTSSCWWLSRWHVWGGQTDVSSPWLLLYASRFVGLLHSWTLRPISRDSTRTVAVFPQPDGPVSSKIPLCRWKAQTESPTLQPPQTTGPKMIRTQAVAEPRVHTGKVFHQQSLIFFLSGRMKHYHLCYSKKNQSMNCLNVITSLSVRMQSVVTFVLVWTLIHFSTSSIFFLWTASSAYTDGHTVA